MVLAAAVFAIIWLIWALRPVKWRVLDYIPAALWVTAGIYVAAAGYATGKWDDPLLAFAAVAGGCIMAVRSMPERRG